MLDRFRNGNGSYDGAKLLSELSGFSCGEITWAAKRVQELSRAGLAVDQILATIKLEAAKRPWLS